MNRRPALESSPGADAARPALIRAADLSWQDRAACQYTDADLFFPEKGGSVRRPKRICRGCEVRIPCLEYALDNGESHGIWGGLSPEERMRLLREPREAARAQQDILRAALDERAARRHPDDLKRCSRCGKTKGLAAFGYASANADGLNYWCGECRAAQRRLERAA